MTSARPTTKPLLCATVTAPTMAKLREARDRVQGADLVELRLDTVSDPDVSAALAGRRQPVIVTCRASWEGGHFKGSEEERRHLLAQALEQGAEYVDIEWRAGFEDLIARTRGRRIVLSFHDFEGVPADLAGTAAAMRATGPEVVKIAAKANRLTDCLTLREIGVTLNANASASGGTRAVVIAMGDAGLATRVLPGRFGSAWTYAGSVRSVGQLTVDALCDTYRFHGIGDNTELYGLVGSPIAHSVSPAMHNAAFRAVDRDAVYLPFPASDADDFVAFAKAMNVQGASVTLPFKVPIGERVDTLDDLARRIGALNTIRNVDGRWEGRNTDVAGFLQPLTARGIALDGCRASVLGAGGSARAVVVALASKGAAITVHARDAKGAERVASLVGARVGEWSLRGARWDVLVNCTPIGMHPHVGDTPVPASDLRGGLVYDLIYNPAQTRLLREASLAGCATIGGLDMLVGQAVEQSEWWTGVRPPAEVMRAAATKRLSEFMTDEDHVV